MNIFFFTCLHPESYSRVARMNTFLIIGIMESKDIDPRLIKLGARLRQLRIQRGETMSIYEKISRDYNVRLKQSHYSKIERGLASPPLRTLFALADYFEVEIVSLFETQNKKGEQYPQYLLQKPDLIAILEQFGSNLGIEKAAKYLKKMVHIFSEFSQDIDTVQHKGKVFRAASKRDKNDSSS